MDLMSGAWSFLYQPGFLCSSLQNLCLLQQRGPGYAIFPLPSHFLQLLSYNQLLILLKTFMSDTVSTHESLRSFFQPQRKRRLFPMTVGPACSRGSLSSCLSPSQLPLLRVL